jgi:hypothetical protein
MMAVILIPCGRKSAEVAWPAYSRKKGGTCDFMTANCQKHCKLKTNEIEIASLEFVEDNPASTVVRQIIKDMQELKATVIAWWLGSGDCPERLTDHITNIIKELSEAQIPQNGFTRNKWLWYNVHYLKNVRFVLTVEKGMKRPDLEYNIGNLIAEPDYENGIVKIYAIRRGKKVATGYTCGAGYVYQIKEGAPPKTFIEDCSLCLKDGVGCYDLIPVKATT